MEFLKRVSGLPVAPISKEDIDILSDILDNSKHASNPDEKLIFNMCTKILDQIRRDKAPLFQASKNQQLP